MVDRDAFTAALWRLGGLKQKAICSKLFHKSGYKYQEIKAEIRICHLMYIFDLKLNCLHYITLHYRHLAAYIEVHKPNQGQMR